MTIPAYVAYPPQMSRKIFLERILISSTVAAENVNDAAAYAMLNKHGLCNRNIIKFMQCRLTAIRRGTQRTPGKVLIGWCVVSVNRGNAGRSVEMLSSNFVGGESACSQWTEMPGLFLSFRGARERI